MLLIAVCASGVCAEAGFGTGTELVKNLNPIFTQSLNKNHAECELSQFHKLPGSLLFLTKQTIRARQGEMPVLIVEAATR